MTMPARSCLISGNPGWPADVALCVQASTLRRVSPLCSEPVALAARRIAIVAAFDAATPADARFSVDTLSAVQPATMSRTRQGVYAGLVHGVRMAGHSDEHEVSVRWVIPRAASYGTAVIGRFVTRICPGASRFVLHDMVVTRAKRPQMTSKCLPKRSS